MVYTAGLLAAFILFYVFSKAERMDVVVIGVLLLFYIPAANHLVLDFFNKLNAFIWCPDVFTAEERPMKILINGVCFAVGITAVKLLFPGSWWSSAVRGFKMLW